MNYTKFFIGALYAVVGVICLFTIIVRHEEVTWYYMIMIIVASICLIGTGAYRALDAGAA